MATDLSDLSSSEPAANDPVASGDDEIRKTRLHLINWAGIEHALTGEHAFLNGNEGAKPAAGTDGRLYYNNDLGRTEIDTGSAWNMLHAIQFASGNTSGNLWTTTAYQTLQSVSINVPASAKFFAIGQFSIANVSGVIEAYTITSRITVDGNALSPVNDRHFYADQVGTGKSSYHQVVVFGLYEGAIAAGAVSVVLEAKESSTSASPYVFDRALWVFAF